ncbi:hypothetical protein [Paraglaciecola marina]|uniref:hypothetical protein n=1 Tax=Paraglaciecola marina TaxID=2500157 RepID=UPI00141514CC|nr:hypothetical protein [Paraglaciecola marina]
MHLQVLKKSFFALAILFLLIFFAFHYFNMSSEASVCIDLFLITWGLDKVVLWYLGEKFGITATVAVPADAHKGVRLIGLIFVAFISIYGAQDLLFRIAT